MGAAAVMSAARMSGDFFMRVFTSVEVGGWGTKLWRRLSGRGLGAGYVLRGSLSRFVVFAKDEVGSPEKTRLFGRGELLALETDAFRRGSGSPWGKGDERGVWETVVVTVPDRPRRPKRLDRIATPKRARPSAEGSGMMTTGVTNPFASICPGALP